MVYILLELLRKNVFNYVKSTKSVNIFHCYCRNIMSCFILTQDVDKRAFKFATQIVHLLLKNAAFQENNSCNGRRTGADSKELRWGDRNLRRELPGIFKGAPVNLCCASLPPLSEISRAHAPAISIAPASL